MRVIRKQPPVTRGLMELLRLGLNQRPSDSQSDALPTELRRNICFRFVRGINSRAQLIYITHTERICKSETLSACRLLFQWGIQDDTLISVILHHESATCVCGNPLTRQTVQSAKPDDWSGLTPVL